MAQYLALLRGINVGGNRLIKMEDLKQIFTDLKFKNVSTYIQSGNVLFDAKEPDLEGLRLKIEKGLLKALGYQVDIYLRSISNMESIIKYDAFKKMNAGEEAKVYVAFLSGTPTREQKKSVEALSNDIDSFHIEENQLYVVSNRGRGDILNTDVLIKKQLAMKSTVRNWNTTQKLYKLMSSEK